MTTPGLTTRPATAAEWDAAWSKCPSATYFQSRAWAEDWASYTRGAMTPRPLVARFADGRSVVLPLTRQRRYQGLLAGWLMSPAGTYGGWLASDPLEDTQVQELATWLRRSRAPLWWRVNPFDPAATALGLDATEQDVTHALPLEWGHESACERASHGHACAVRKAERAGVNVRRAREASDWEAYYQIYEQALARWGENASSRYSADLFELLRRRGSPSVELWLATLEDGAIIGGGLCLYAPRHVSYWHGATLAEFFGLRPANLLVHAMTLDACERSLDWFDLNPSGGHAGVRVFKERVGAVELPSPVITCDSSRHGVVERAMRLVRKTPHGAG